MRLRTVLLGLALVLAVLALVAFALAAPGVYDRYPRALMLTAAGRRAAPAWTAACRNPVLETNADACVRVRGRIVWIQHHDPDGDGDRHLVLVSRLHPRIVKLIRSFRVPHLPGIGRVISAAGWDETGGSGHDEIDATRLTIEGSGETLIRGPGPARRVTPPPSPGAP